MADIFISYSRVDRALAEELAQRFIADGRSVWWDAEATAGQNFREEISKELDAAKTVVVLWSPSSVQSHWVISEAQRAARTNKLFPLRTPDLDPSNIPQPFDVLHTPSIDTDIAIGAKKPNAKHGRIFSTIWLIAVLAMGIAWLADTAAFFEKRTATLAGQYYSYDGRPLGDSANHPTVTDALLEDRIRLGIDGTRFVIPGLKGTDGYKEVSDHIFETSWKLLGAPVRADARKRLLVTGAELALSAVVLLLLFRHLSSAGEPKKASRFLGLVLGSLCLAVSIASIDAYHQLS